MKAETTNNHGNVKVSKKKLISSNKYIRIAFILVALSPLIGLYSVLTSETDGVAVARIIDVDKYKVDEVLLQINIDGQNYHKRSKLHKGQFDLPGQKFIANYDLNDVDYFIVNKCKPVFYSTENIDSARGIVTTIDFQRKALFKKFWIFKPIVTYQYSVKGIRYSRKQTICADGKTEISYTRGDTLNVIYLKANPTISMINGTIIKR